MIVLSIDSCLGACSAAVLDGDRVLAARAEPMMRGHQERLAPLVQEVMAEAGIGFDRLDRIGVTLGPGSFTGLRVGLAFAEGLSAALNVPLVGVGSLEALVFGLRGYVVAAVDARREQIYLQLFRGGQPLSEPRALSLAEADQLIGSHGLPERLIGSGAPLLGASYPAARIDVLAAPDPVAIARLAAAGEPSDGTPKPLYLRAPDAKLPGGKDLPAS